MQEVRHHDHLNNFNEFVPEGLEDDRVAYEGLYGWAADDRLCRREERLSVHDQRARLLGPKAEREGQGVQGHLRQVHDIQSRLHVSVATEVLEKCDRFKSKQKTKDKKA